MTKEELDFIGSMNMFDEISNDAYKKIVCHVEETIVSEDCVSRQAVKEGMRKYGFHSPDMTITEFIEDELLLVTPTRKVGKWICVHHLENKITYDSWKCSECQHDFNSEEESTVDFDEYKFCPNCGAEMRGSKNE